MHLGEPDVHILVHGCGIRCSTAASSKGKVQYFREESESNIVLRVLDQSESNIVLSVRKQRRAASSLSKSWISISRSSSDRSS